MKTTISLCFVFLVFNLRLKAQNQWMETKDWTIYKIHGHGIFGYPPDTLKNFPSYRLQPDSLNTFLKSISELPTKSPVTWMGGYVVSYVQGKELRKAEVSAYGGFFYDDKTGKTFELPEELRSDWLAFFRTAYLQLQGSVQ